MVRSRVIPPISKAAQNSFNAVRLLAALQVAYVHAVANLNLDRGFGWEWIVQFPGVPIFFAVSGYLVLDSMIRLPIGEFIRHRAARIYPALAVNIAIIEGLLWLSGQSDFSPYSASTIFQYFEFYVLTASNAVAALAAGADFPHNFEGFFKIYPSGVLWTLTVELTFYVVIIGFKASGNRIIRTLLVVEFCRASLAIPGYRLVLPENWLFLLSVLPYFWMFGVGMLFRLWRPPTWSAWLAIPALLGAFAAVAWSRQLEWMEWKIEPHGATAAQVILLCLLSLWIGYSPLLKSRFLARNDMSYGLYLYHMLIVVALMNVMPSRWLILMVLGGGMLAGLLSWHLIERPSMKLAQTPTSPSRKSHP